MNYLTITALAPLLRQVPVISFVAYDDNKAVPGGECGTAALGKELVFLRGRGWWDVANAYVGLSILGQL